MKCSVENGLYDYIREKARRIIERNKDYGRGDTKLHVSKQYYKRTSRNYINRLIS